MPTGAPFLVSDEQRALRSAVADLMARHSSEAQVRTQMATDTGLDPTVWHELAAMGLTGLLIDEGHGGAGAGPVEMGIAMEEMGRTLLVGPFLSTAVLVPSLLAATGDAAECGAVLPRIAAGELIATVAFAEDGSARLPGRIATSAGQIGDTWHVTGYKHFVLDGQSAELLYVLAATDAGPAVFAVDAGAPGLAVTPLTTVDPTRKQCRLQFVDTPARLIGRPGAGVEEFNAALDACALALVSEQAGGARRAVEMATEYAKTRYQFGRAIGSFQAVKHMCADMLLEAESTVSAARFVAELIRRACTLPYRGSCSGTSLLLGCLRLRRGDQHPGTRRHRIHLGASGALVSASSPKRRPVAGQSVVAPGTLPAADRSLSCD